MKRVLESRSIFAFVNQNACLRLESSYFSTAGGGPSDGRMDDFCFPSRFHPYFFDTLTDAVSRLVSIINDD